MSSRLDNALQRWWLAAEQRRWLYGLVGRVNDDETVTVTVAERPDFVHIRMGSGETQTLAMARNQGRVPLRAGLPVKMRREAGVLVIEDVDRSGLLEDDANAPGTVYSVNSQTGDVVLGFTDLDDTPANYTGSGAQFVKVKATEDGLEFVAGAGGAVDSVNGQTGVVVLDSDDIGEGVTNLWFTAAEESKLAGIEALADVTDAVNVGAAIHGATAKTTPVDADTLAGIDSAASNVLTRFTWANIKATLKTYFDTLYTAINTAVLLTGNQTVAGDKTFTGIPVIGDGTTHAQMFFDGAAGSSKQFGYRTGGVNRWLLGTTTDAESGSNLGTNFQINARDDAGGALAVALFIKRSTGNVGIGSTDPTARLHVTGDVNTAILLDGTTSPRLQLTVGGTNRGFVWANATYAAFGQGSESNSIIVLSNGNVGIGTASAQGRLHVHDGTSGWLMVTKSAVDGTAQTVIPDGTGDIVRRVTYNAILVDSAGATSNLNSSTMLPGGSQVMNTTAGNEVTFAVSAGGAFTVQRTLGALTFTISLELRWQ